MPLPLPQHRHLASGNDARRAPSPWRRWQPPLLRGQQPVIASSPLQRPTSFASPRPPRAVQSPAAIHVVTPPLITPPSYLFSPPPPLPRLRWSTQDKRKEKNNVPPTSTPSAPNHEDDADDPTELPPARRRMLGPVAQDGQTRDIARSAPPPLLPPLVPPSVVAPRGSLSPWPQGAPHASRQVGRAVDGGAVAAAGSGFMTRRSAQSRPPPPSRRHCQERHVPPPSPPPTLSGAPLPHRDHKPK